MTYTNVFGGGVPPSQEMYAAYVLTTNETLYWPDQYDGTTGLVAASIMEVSAGAGLTLTLPPANQTSVGYDLLLRNVGAESLDVTDSAGGAVATILAGESRYIYVADNSTAAGIWRLFTYGTGTSSADASELAGLGLQASSGKLRVSTAYRSINSTGNILSTDRCKLLEVISGSITLTLPQASTVGDGFMVYLHNTAAGSVVLEGYSAETVDGSLNKTLFPGESLIAVCNGTYWLTVGYGKDVEFTFSEFVVDMAGGDATLTSEQVAGRMIRLAGVAAGDLTITLPTVDNIYFLNVEVGLGGFDAIFTTGSGSTLTLGASQKTVIYCDGTNVTAAITTSVTTTIQLDDGSAAVPSLGFDLDEDTGIFRPGDNTIGFTAGGVQVAAFDADGLTASVVFTPVGSISATTVAGALAELDGDLTTVAGAVSANTTAIGVNTAAIADHIADPTAAHDASAIAVTPTGTIASTDVQAAIAELDTDTQAAGTAISDHLADPTDAHAASAVGVTPAGDLAATDVQAALEELDDEKVPRTATTGSAVVPSGTEAQRDGTPAAGYLRFNSDTGSFEGYDGTDWGSIGGGASGGGGNAAFYENDTNVTVDYTITSGKNAMSAGPITIDDGITVTVPSGSVWTIV